MSTYDYPPEFQRKMDGLKISWAWLALLVGPACIGFGIFFFIEAWQGPGFAYWEENFVYKSTECTILDKKISFIDTQHGRASRPELLIEYRYKDEGYQLWTYRRDTLLGDAYIRPRPPDEDSSGITPEQAQARAQKVLDRYPVGSKQECWVDPNEPSKAILRKWRYVGLLLILPGVGLLALALGIVSLCHLFSKLYQRYELKKRFEKNPEGWNHGIQYPFRLEPEAESDAERLLKIFVTVFWTAFAIIGNGVFFEKKIYLGLLITIPYSLLGMILILKYFMEMVSCRIGETEVEMEFQPLVVGRTGKVLIMQQPPLKIEEYFVTLRCRELTTFTEGTDTKTDSKDVFRQPLHEENGMTFPLREPHQIVLTLVIPENCPTSFKSEHNEIRWEIVVEGSCRGRSVFSRNFPFGVQARPVS